MWELCMFLHPLLVVDQQTQAKDDNFSPTFFSSVLCGSPCCRADLLGEHRVWEIGSPKEWLIHDKGSWYHWGRGRHGRGVWGELLPDIQGDWCHQQGFRHSLRAFCKTCPAWKLSPWCLLNCRFLKSNSLSEGLVSFRRMWTQLFGSKDLLGITDVFYIESGSLWWRKDI